MDVCIEFVPILSNGELLIIIDRDVDFLLADRLIIRVMKLSNVRMSQGLISRESFIRVELKEVP